MQVRFNKSLPVLQRMRNNNKRRQSGKGAGENLAKLTFEMGSKALKSSFGRRLISKGIDNIPNIFKYGVSKIQNKNLKRALDLEVADMVVEEAERRAGNKFDLLFIKNGCN